MKTMWGYVKKRSVITAWAVLTIALLGMATPAGQPHGDDASAYRRASGG